MPISESARASRKSERHPVGAGENRSRMARVLITGGAGYVGSHCAKALAASGHEVVVFDTLAFGHREFVRWGQLIEGDVRDSTAVDTLFSTQQCYLSDAPDEAR